MCVKGISSNEEIQALTEIHDQWIDGLITMSDYVFAAKRLGYTIVEAGQFLNDGHKRYEDLIIQDTGNISAG